MSNTSDPAFRVAHERQGGPQFRTAELFRLEGRTVVSKLMSCPQYLLYEQPSC